MTKPQQSSFICPVCGGGLVIGEKSLSCSNNHLFDTAKSGYTNLLLSQKTKAKHHGDDKRMVRSRQAFLNKGFYNPLLNSIAEIVRQNAKSGDRVLDAGCGECWYTANIRERLLQNGLSPRFFGVDISKEALAAGAKRSRDIELAVASVFHLPVATASCDMVLSVFAPTCGAEFARVLKKNGMLIRAVPLERHLWGLKAAVYDKPYENEAENLEVEGFELTKRQEIRQSIALDSAEDIQNLFAMTPYYYKTGAEDQKKLQALSVLVTDIEFGILVYRKR